MTAARADPGVLALNAALEFLLPPGALGVGVDGPGERRAHPAEMRASFRRAHVVHEGMERLPIAAVPLQRHFTRVRAGGRAAVRYVRGLHLEADDRGMDRVLVVVQVRYELGNSTLVVKDGALTVALVHQFDPDPPHQKRQLPYPVGDLVEIELGGLFENGWIGKEVNEGSGVFRGRPADRLERSGSLSAAVGLRVDRPVSADLHPEPGGERVHDRNADPVQTGRVLVGVGVELAARMQPGHHHLDRRKPGAGLGIHRNAPAVVANRQAAVLMDGHLDAAAVTRHRLVDAVVHHLPEEVMQPGLSRGADVHRGPDPHGLETLEDLDVPARVRVRGTQYGAIHCSAP